jgi:PEP-CTERM motif-containing protein
MKHKKRVWGMLTAALMLGLATQQAAAISTVGNCDLNDVTSDIYGAADACYGLVDGNISESGTYAFETMIPDAAFGGAFAGDNWSVAPISFDTTTHTWSGSLAGYSELIIVLKQSTLWGAWYFNPSDEFGTWSTAWDYPNGKDNQGGGLSHGFALVRGSLPPTKVPEPKTMALFGLGLALVGLRVRRRSRAE